MSIWTMSTSRQIDDGPGVLQLCRWTVLQPHLKLSEFREAFISPTRRLFGLLSEHGKALSLSIVLHWSCWSLCPWCTGNIVKIFYHGFTIQGILSWQLLRSTHHKLSHIELSQIPVLRQSSKRFLLFREWSLWHGDTVLMLLMTQVLMKFLWYLVTLLSQSMHSAVLTKAH